MLSLLRDQILAYRRRVSGLDARRPLGEESLRRAAWAGLQDSMPRAAVLSIHARIQDTEPDTWRHPSLAQVWGPRFSVFVIAARDRGVFTLGRHPDDEVTRRRAEDLADRLETLLGDGSMRYSDAGKALDEPPNRLRYATTTGRLVLRWEGAGRPTISMVPAPEVDPVDARIELARRYLHVYGPSDASGFATWAGIKPPAAAKTFEALDTTPVRSPIGERWLLSEDVELAGQPSDDPAPARLLPSGDSFYLLQGAQRELLVTDAAKRDLLWTSRVWPGAIVVRGEVAGVWRRSGHRLTLQPWQRLSKANQRAVIAEAESLPLSLDGKTISVSWD